jgi:predicted CopG family antitoxin
MALLEKVNALKQQNMSDLDIFNSLKEDGFSPREVSEALNQSKIKSAISENSEEMMPSIMQQQNNSQDAISGAISQQIQSSYNQNYTPQNQPYNQEQQYSQGYSQPYTQEQQYAPASYDQPQYADQNYQQPSVQEQYADQTYQQGVDIDTVREIASQETEAKTKKMEEKIEVISKFKTELNFQVQSIENRLEKMESLMHELQTAIIRKMGEYGEAVSGISKELKATQDSFSKVINPLIDHKRGIHEKPEEKSEEQAEEKKETQEHHKVHQEEKGKKGSKMHRGESSVGVEDYFR